MKLGKLPKPSGSNIIKHHNKSIGVGAPSVAQLQPLQSIGFRVPLTTRTLDLLFDLRGICCHHRNDEYHKTMALARLQMPPLPVPPSWFPGHMMKFTRTLPTLLTRTDVVLEIRDSRLPLTSINRTLEGGNHFLRVSRIKSTCALSLFSFAKMNFSPVDRSPGCCPLKP